jgi:glyoxylase I family protein
MLPALETWHTAMMESLANFHHVALTVTNLDRSAAWYAEVLGMVELRREESPTRRAAIYRFDAGHMSVGLVEHSGQGNDAFSPVRCGLDHLAFQIDSQKEMSEWSRHLDQYGVDHSGPITVPPGEILNFKDPDGIALALFWDRER